MFDYTYNFELSKENLASLEIAVNPDNYCSPLLKTSIAETQKQLTEDSNFKISSIVSASALLFHKCGVQRQPNL